MINPHAAKIADYSTDSLAKILRALQAKTVHDEWDHQRMNAIKSELKKRGIIIS